MTRGQWFLFSIFCLLVGIVLPGWLMAGLGLLGWAFCLFMMLPDRVPGDDDSEDYDEHTKDD